MNQTRSLTPTYRDTVTSFFVEEQEAAGFIIFVSACICLSTLAYHLRQISKPRVFLVDFACFKPRASLMSSKELVVERSRKYGNFTEENLQWIHKLLEKSGMGQSTYLPKALLNEPPTFSIVDAREEAEMVIFGAVDELLSKTSVKIKEIGIVIVNCCIFNDVPSLSAMIINKYKLDESVISYNLSGMGCSAGLQAITLAQHLLKVHENSYALVVSTENLTQNCYMGNERSMLLINCLFRVGGAAILLSNMRCDEKISKYQLMHCVGTHSASCDASYKCIFQAEDPEGHAGVIVNKDLLAVASKAIQTNIITVGRLVLPLSEKLFYLVNLFALRFRKMKPYVPDFTKSICHVITHVGGKPVLDEVERNLKLSDVHMEPSRMTLYRFGNTSSSSIWYGLAYVEAKGRMKRNDRVWQMAFGSGFKCVSVIWKAIRDIGKEECNPWSDEIDGFPVKMVDPSNCFPYHFEKSKIACELNGVH